MSLLDDEWQSSPSPPPVSPITPPVLGYTNSVTYILLPSCSVSLYSSTLACASNSKMYTAINFVFTF